MKFGIHEAASSHPGDGVYRNEQHKFKFDNGFGASVIRGQFSHGGLEGLWELAVIGLDGCISYETPITDDVEGYLSEADVAALLDSIAALQGAEVSA